MPRRRGGSFSHIRQFQIHRYLGMTSLQLGEDFKGTAGGTVIYSEVRCRAAQPAHEMRRAELSTESESLKKTLIDRKAFDNALSVILVNSGANPFTSRFAGYRRP
jgi:hypothetical protein